MDRPKAIEDFVKITGIIQRREFENPALPHLIDQLVDTVGVIQHTNKKPACADCRARRMCIRNLAVPVITHCEVCDKEIVFVIPVSSQDAAHWDHPISRISQLCPRAVRKKFFAKCPACLKYPGKLEQIQKWKENGQGLR